MMVMMILISLVMIGVADGDVLFIEKEKDRDECERPP